MSSQVARGFPKRIQNFFFVRCGRLFPHQRLTAHAIYRLQRDSELGALSSNRPDQIRSAADLLA